MPEVSIIMPNYNCAGFIGEAIESVLAQTYQDRELIICEDCSTDRSPEIIAGYAAKEPRIRVYRNEKNRGLAASRNRAIALAQGEYIALLDSDDIWYPQKLDVQLRYMREQNIDICYAAYDIMTEEGKKIATIFPPPPPIRYKELLKGMRINVPTTIVKRSILPPDPFPSIAPEDLAMWFCVMRLGHVAHIISIPLASYRLRRKALSANKLLMAFRVWGVMRDQEKVPLWLRSYYFSCYCIAMFRKYAPILLYVFRFR